MNSKLKPILAAVMITAGVSAHAQTVPLVACTATGGGALACAGAAVVIHELVQLGNGKKPGPNGEGMKVVNGVGDVVAGIFGWDGGRGGTRPSPAEVRQERLEKKLNKHS